MQKEDFDALLTGMLHGRGPNLSDLIFVAGKPPQVEETGLLHALEMAGPEPTRAEMLRVINEVGQFDISGDHLTVGHKVRDASSRVFLTLIQPDGTFKPIDGM